MYLVAELCAVGMGQDPGPDGGGVGEQHLLSREILLGRYEIMDIDVKMDDTRRYGG